MLKPSLTRQRVRSVLETGLARTAEKSVPSSGVAWYCSYDVAAMTRASANKTAVSLRQLTG
jgi:hypothetical protein